ncbi:hypothetical protein NMY22_g966 [Coprinellus aureogranulatus]|nr:hypothetical protein NMY22_g966 [Coprinellus aureogranulatus]
MCPPAANEQHRWHQVLRPQRAAAPQEVPAYPPSLDILCNYGYRDDEYSEVSEGCLVGCVWLWFKLVQDRKQGHRDKRVASVTSRITSHAFMGSLSTSRLVADHDDEQDASRAHRGMRLQVVPTIGPFTNFTSVIGPNGAGKSNLMDAISFVLGVKSAQLRSSQLKDLVYRGRRLANGTQTQDDEEDEEEGEGEGTAKKAWVMAVFKDEKGKEWTFQRTISTSGASEYKLNKKVVTYSAYNAALVSHNILVKAKNFLVFQGDVEAVASQSPRELSRLIEQISGSLELAGEYEKAKEEQDKATENATFNFTKRRGIAGEIKQYKEQKTEAERFEGLCQERDELILQRILLKLFHIEEAIENNSHAIVRKNKELAGLREEQAAHDEALNAARQEQAKARSVVMQKEKQIKKAEKAVDAKKPELAALEAQITHATRKLQNAQKSQAEIAKSEDQIRAKVDNLKKELTLVKREAEKAAEEQRKLSRHNIALSEESLAEYQALKSSSSKQAVDERQQLETLSREEKTASRTLAQLTERNAGFEEKKKTRSEDLQAQLAKKAELDQRLATLQKTQEAPLLVFRDFSFVERIQSSKFILLSFEFGDLCFEALGIHTAG